MGADFVNGPELKQKAGIYIWLGYDWQTPIFIYALGAPTAPTPLKIVWLLENYLTFLRMASITPNTTTNIPT
ncbi:hypothetical protein [Helicobacter ailurogastricus]|uniref:hypothetical protein n=1 Tax=Helicobacter ailurogastricus TaxID=1578720 RepID=UPI0024911B37|nr:hypothetical protein [Helicobacter ailurogastricus]